MPSKYDPELKAKAVRPVREHREEYETEWAAIRAVSSRLGMTAETLRKWVRQAEVDDGQAAGMTTRESQELRELRKKNRELEETIEILKAATSFFVRASDRDAVDLCVHCRALCSVRDRSDLPGAHRARVQDRSENVLRMAATGAVKTGPVGHDDHRDPGRLLRA